VYALPAGAALFVPAGAAFSLRTAAATSPAALCLLLALAPQPGWAGAMSAALDGAQDDVAALAPGRRLFPHAPGAAGAGAHLAAALDALFAAARARAAAAAADAGPTRGLGVSAAHFDVAAWVSSRYDLETLLDAGGGIAEARAVA
jgi:hypothetical protein